MSPQARMAAGNAPLPEAGVSSGSDAGAGPFVINLTSSTTPMALAHPDSPELKRFSFFVSRRREDNRERFRLHMGYFSTLAEAEEWLNVIRDLYPGAWAGEAPGKKLRARAAAAELAKQLPPPPAPRQFAPPPQPNAKAAQVAARAPAPKPAAADRGVTAPAAAAAAKPSAADLVVPTLKAAPPSYPPAPQATVAPSAAPMLEAVAQAAAALAAVAKTAVAQSVSQTAPAEITYVPPAPVASPAAKAPATQPISFSAPMPAASAPSSGVPSTSSRAVAAAAAAAAAAARPAPGVRPGTAGAQPNQAQPNRSVQPKPGVDARSAQAKAAGTAAAASAGQAGGARMAAPAPGRPAQQPPAKAKKTPPNVMTDGSNVREVMASLDETGETGQTRIMRVPPGLASPAQSANRSPVASGQASAPVARNAGGTAGRAPSAPTQSARGQAPSAPPRAGAPAASSTGDSMSDTQVLRMLEARRPDSGERVSDDNSGISLLKPDDTQTRRALKEAVIDNAPVSFAVQLQWSVQPVDLSQVPPLAIFSAYTLYTVEGSREGRKWYGLRLGFFSDAISAKQVAYYVRSEFASVAVVPVSPAEKGRASESEAKTATGAFQRKHVEQKIEEFKLFDDEKPAASEPPKAAEPAPAKPAAAKTAAPTRKNRVKAKEQRSPKTLEETLEILGASDLEIDNGRGELLNDTGVRHLRVEVQKNTPFAKLLDRISERVRKN